MDDMKIFSKDGVEAFAIHERYGEKRDYPLAPEMSWIKLKCKGSEYDEFTNVKPCCYYILKEPHLVKIGWMTVIKDSKGNLFVPGDAGSGFHDESDWIYQNIIENLIIPIQSVANKQFFNFISRNNKETLKCPVCYEFNPEVIECRVYCRYCGNSIDINDYYKDGDWKYSSRAGWLDPIYCKDCANKIIEYDMPMMGWADIYEPFFEHHREIVHILNGQEVKRITAPKRKVTYHKKRKWPKPPPYWFQGYRPPGRMP